jgi:hypothetical protein
LSRHDGQVAIGGCEEYLLGTDFLYKPASELGQWGGKLGSVSEAAVAQELGQAKNPTRGVKNVVKKSALLCLVCGGPAQSVCSYMSHDWISPSIGAPKQVLACGDTCEITFRGCILYVAYLSARN